MSVDKLSELTVDELADVKACKNVVFTKYGHSFVISRVHASAAAAYRYHGL